MGRYVFYSHDGYGLGHARRNTLIARALLAVDPAAEISVISGVSPRHWRFGVPGVRVVHVPPLQKGPDGAYRAGDLPFEAAIAARTQTFREEIEAVVPDVVIVDRHPYGVAGELRPGLELARRLGAALIIGLRDLLDDPAVIAAELAGKGWEGVADCFDDVLVYGSKQFCDHEDEYGLPIRPKYCGFVTDVASAATVDSRLLVVAAGGGGDGESVFRLGAATLARRSDWRGIIVAGPYADEATLRGLGLDAGARVEVRHNVKGYPSLCAGAGATLQMAGCNSTFEALGAGLRPILVPRRSPRREQLIRATRLAALGLADVVDEEASSDEVVGLLDVPRRLEAGALESAGISLDGAACAAGYLRRVALARSHR